MKTNAGALLSSIRIDRAADRKISVQLYLRLKDILLSGGVNPGERLPATRTLAKEIGVSRTTVIDAIDRLTAEGLLDARVGAGTFVSQALAGRPASPAAPRPAAGESHAPSLSQAAADARERFAPRAWLPHKSQAFITALPALDLFPMAHWARLSARHWRAGRDDVMGYGHPSGHQGLREAIATHLNAARGIRCDPDQLFVVAGAQQAFFLISTLLLNPGERVWFENPGAIGARNAFVAGGAEIVPVDIDAEGLSVVDGLRKAPAFRLAFVTPSHQQPLGQVMSLRRRLALLQAADEADALIVEDDYDGEFYYGNQPQPSLKSIDTRDRVIYVGTFSKSLFPSLRLGFILVPRNLVGALAEVSAYWLSGVPTATQAIVADFMNEGLFATHIRLMRRAYKARHDALLEAAASLRPHIDIRPTSSGFHTVGFLPAAADEDRIVAGAREKGIIVAPLSRYSATASGRKGLVLGFGGVTPDDIRRGVRKLADLPELARPLV
ncbi:MocR-like pyridoxine biosynthesis transcription factor PdxR [Oceanibacterium hippocampi]|uniref:HTH-type transcriptional regulatory protein GabR n=1 Tax=Oceanibacterium hippocampi TaxID=745714 RepID=A0A1Y5TJV2_9PROT|nr:PLP-dependent aminotransferase family protein [Oceanibacterium hippocampi]SLN63656.1 HTH-type transcriptional regulatory protein GabR [Oceanibacterium hippocampi]